MTIQVILPEYQRTIFIAKETLVGVEHTESLRNHGYAVWQR